MRKHSIWVVMLPLLLLFASVTAAGILMREEPIWGLGLGLFLFVIIIIPGFSMRQKHLGRIKPEHALARWGYSYNESDILADALLAQSAKRRRILAILLCVCLAFMGVIFINVIKNGDPSIPLWRLLLLLVPAALPWLGIWLYRIYLKNLIRREPCETIIGRNFLIYANTCPTMNERTGLNAAGAELRMENGACYLKILYKSTTRSRYGQVIKFTDNFSILVPAGREDEARALEGLLGKNNAKD